MLQRPGLGACGPCCCPVSHGRGARGAAGGTEGALCRLCGVTMAIGERESKQMEQNPSQHGGISGLPVEVWLVTAAAGRAVCGTETSLSFGAVPVGEMLSTELNPSPGTGWVPTASSQLSAEGLRGPQFLDSVLGLLH